MMMPLLEYAVMSAFRSTFSPCAAVRTWLAGALQELALVFVIDQLTCAL
jgi:hypothetical protein